jgi:hypothetical protein
MIRRKKKSRSGTPTTLNADRGRPMVTLTLSPEGLYELDRQRGTQPRGAYVESLLARRSARFSTGDDLTFADTAKGPVTKF